MEAPSRPSNESIEASKWNAQLARRVSRWKRLRLSLAILLTGAGAATFLFGSASIWSVPCFITALIAYLLYLDSRDQLREIRSRNWATITPRISGASQRTHEGVKTTPSR
jgi:hypothetical protein